MSDLVFTIITEKDLPEVSALYNHYVLHSTATFHAHRMDCGRVSGHGDVRRPQIRHHT